LAVDGGVDQHAGAIEHHPVQRIAIGESRRLEPSGPGAAIIKVQERQLEHVFRPLQSGAERRAAHREQLFAA
jgi:hypothetical protein